MKYAAAALLVVAAVGRQDELPTFTDRRTGPLFEGGAVVVPAPPPEHVTATAYCGCPICCGTWSTQEAITASGAPAVEGRTIAADWRVFPKGSCLVLETLGRRVVHDTGSAIRGAKVDVFFDSHEAAKEFGVKRLEVRPC